MLSLKSLLLAASMVFGALASAAQPETAEVSPLTPWKAPGVSSHLHPVMNPRSSHPVCTPCSWRCGVDGEDYAEVCNKHGHWHKVVRCPNCQQAGTRQLSCGTNPSPPPNTTLSTVADFTAAAIMVPDNLPVVHDDSDNDDDAAEEAEDIVEYQSPAVNLALVTDNSKPHCRPGMVRCKKRWLGIGRDRAQVCSRHGKWIKTCKCKHCKVAGNNGIHCDDFLEDTFQPETIGVCRPGVSCHQP
ncbi:hypothetical protein F4780DRAFT_777356 [Xylariomycetidae sp. FL0641]|nr:hypothetical protein F4780DRAFT_777356 [Xylariomycetidae sp. FL0641]